MTPPLQRPAEPADAYSAAVAIVRRLREAGHVAYLAGGCVRDTLLGHQPTDYDVATDALPDAVRRLFRRSRYVGEAFGVVLVRLGEQEVEVATFRTESGYSDGRHPDRVEFTNAENDAGRRDFTINGLFADPLVADGGPTAADPTAFRVIDYVGGVADLEAGLVRAIGDPDARFAEDYLRMLRAARFAARLEFEVEAKTAAAIRPLAKYLGQISRERIGMEVTAMMHPPVGRDRVGHARARAVELMQALRLDGVVLNEDPRARAPRALARLPADASPGTALAAWMLDRYAEEPTPAAIKAFIQVDAPRLIGRWRASLCLSNDVRDDLKRVLSLVHRALGWSELGVAGRKRLLAERMWGDARDILIAVGESLADRVRAIDRDAEPLRVEGVAPPPLITGDDLVAAGLQPGPDFGRWLEGVYDAQLEGRVTTREQALAWVAAQPRGG